MPVTQRSYGPGLSPMLSLYSREGNYGMALSNFNICASQAWPTTNLILYYPIVLPRSGVAYKLWWLNGATATTNNVQIGIYADSAFVPGAAIVRGTSTLVSGANVVQYDDIANTAIGPGRAWLAIWGSGTTMTFFAQVNVPIHMVRAYQESNAGGLPATATPATASATNYMPIFGIQTRPSP